MERWEEIRHEVNNVYLGPDREFSDDPRWEQLGVACKRIAEFEEMLKRLEWSSEWAGEGDTYNICPCCGGFEDLNDEFPTFHRHSHDCKLDQLINNK